MSFSIEREKEEERSRRRRGNKTAKLRRGKARQGSSGNLPHFAAGQSGVENPLVKGISNIYAFKLHQLQPRAFTRRMRNTMSNGSVSASGRQRGVAAATLMQFSLNFNKK